MISNHFFDIDSRFQILWKRHSVRDYRALERNYWQPRTQSFIHFVRDFEYSFISCT